ncbi:MAG: type VI secretion system baseplate subunit TssF [Stellaceae bacterium]
MADDLLRHYNDELAYIRRSAADFAEAHPKIAGRLRLGSETSEDPHVGRLIEAFAFLSARLKQKIDDDFPELTDGLLNVLYPHYLAPIPSMAIVQFGCDPDLSQPQTVPAGIELDTELVQGEMCRYRTCYPVEMLPIQIDSARVTGRPLVAPPNPLAPGAMATLQLALSCISPDMTFTRLGIDRLRFFIRGQPQTAFTLYEMLFNNTVSIALAETTTDNAPVLLPADAIKPVGFARDEGVLPLPQRSLPGYRLLTEYFAFPEKLMFFDITGLSAKLLVESGQKLNIFIYFNRAVPGFDRSISGDNFLFGCTPIVNLFQQPAEPFPLTEESTEYRIVPDVRRPGATEIYSIERVIATAPDGGQTVHEPFYSTRHGEQARAAYWHAVRRPGKRADGGTEVFLTLVDEDFERQSHDDRTLSVDTWCLNRDLPSKLPFGGGRPRFELVQGQQGIASVFCVTPPTSTLRPAGGGGGRWRLISHLSLNRLSLIDGEEGRTSLREMLRLYDFRDSPETRAIIDSVLSVKAARGIARAPSREFGAFCGGNEVTIEFDDERFTTSGIFLLAMVLERFLAHQCSINAFSRLTATVRGRSGILRRWSPRAGDLPLL